MENLKSEIHPAVRTAAERFGLAFEVMDCDPNLADTAAFCEHYKFAPEETCNAIIAASKSDPVQYACCLILATCKLDVNKKVSQLMGIKRLSFASAEQTLELTGMQIGGVTPVGIPEIPIYIDAAIMNNNRVVIGGGNRSTKLLMDPKELLKLPHAEVIENLGIPR